MVNLVIMRHGEAEPLKTQDRVRKLTEQGKQDVSQMASWLQQHYAAFDWIWSSPYTRTRQTAELMRARQPEQCQLEIVPELIPEGDPELVREYLDARLAENPDANILLVSHMPLVSFLVSAFTTSEHQPVFCTSDIIRIQYKPGKKGRLKEQISPKTTEPLQC